MEEVDAILFPILRESGCPLPADVTSMKQLDADLFYTSCVTILRLINAASSPSSHHTPSPLTKHPLAMPTGKAARFRITSALCAELKEKGYASELGYEAFLYPNEADMRAVLRFLVEKLPKSEPADDTDARPSAPTDVHARIAAALAAFTKQTTPAALTYRPFHTVHLELPALSPPAALAYARTHQPLLPLQPADRANFVPSLLETNMLALLEAAEREKQWNDPTAPSPEQRRAALTAVVRSSLSSTLAAGSGARAVSRKALAQYSVVGDRVTGGAGASAFGRRIQFEQEREAAQAQVVSEVGTVTSVNEAGQSAEEREAEEEERRRSREQQLNELNQSLTDHTAQLSALDARIASFTSSSRQLEAELAALASTTSALEDAYRVRKRTLDLLPDAHRNEAELRALVDASSQRLLDIAAEWETHRQALLTRLRRHQALLQERKEGAAAKAESIKSMREEQKAKADDVRAKEALLVGLQAELAALPKSTHRSVYVRRIMDIMRNIDKQKAEIGRVLADVKQIQRDINALTEASNRAYAMADDIVFSSAKQGGGGPEGVRAYRCVVELREAFGALVGVVEAIGRVQGEERELQASVEDLDSRNTALNMERVETDLAQVRKENKQLQAKLKR